MMPHDSREQYKPTLRARLSRLLPGRRAKAAAAVCLVLGIGGGYIVGQHHPAMHEAEVRCLSAVGGISCTDDPDLSHGDFWIPRDVAWTDSDGSLHMHGRPECLPPTGRGTDGPVGITWLTVEVSGTSWKQAVGVEC